MSAERSIGSRFASVLVPTPGQALGSIMAALLLLAGTYSNQLLKRVGIGSTAITAAQDQLHAHVSAILTSPLVSSAALVTFWAGVGLVAYLVSWSAYNVLIEARNEVTLNTGYSNRGRWHGHIEPLAFKTTGAVALVVAAISLKPGLMFWTALVAPSLAGFSLSAILIALVAVLGMAAQFYVIFALVLITFTAWYRY